MLEELFADLIEENETILLGFSGGVDSVVLLDLLLKYQQQKPFQIELYHLNHQLRQTAKRDADFTITTAKRLKLVLHLEEEDILALARTQKKGIEETAREVRYAQARRIMDQEGIRKLFLAHHLTDQVETFFLHLLRGAGLSGLTGMKRLEGYRIRPLLDWSKQDIEAYAASEKLPFVYDETNEDTAYRRNFIRHEVLPILQKASEGNLEEQIRRTIGLLRSDDEALEDEAERIGVRESYPLEELKALPQAVLSRVFRAILRHQGSLKNIGSERLLSLIQFVRGDYQGEVELNGVIFSKEQGLLMIRDEKLEPLGVQEILPGRQTIPGGILLMEESNVARGDLAIPKHLIKGRLRLRPRNSGDSFALSEDSHKSLKQWFIDEKIPRSLRDRIALLTDDERVYWIIGYRRSYLAQSQGPFICLYFTKDEK